MSVVNFLASRWAQSGYLTRTVAVVYAAPVVVWGVCTLEATLRCALRALHSAVAFNQQSRTYRWEEARTHFWTAYGTGLLTGVSVVPMLGTGRSYHVMLKMVMNHTTNTWHLREMQHRTNTHAADTLYQELNAWEPDLDKIFSDAVEKVAPTQEQINTTADNLRASLIGNNWIFTLLFHTVDGSCKAVRIVAIRVGRIISAIFSGRIIHFIVRTAEVFKEAIKTQVQYTCDLIEKPGKGSVPQRALPEIYRDALFCILEKCQSPNEDWREATRLAIAGKGATDVKIVPKSNYSRQCAISNSVARFTSGVRLPLPEGAPNDYFHQLKQLPRACTHFSRVKATKPVADVNIEKAEILKYFQHILPVIESFDAACTANMTGEAKQELLWTLTRLMPNLREITLDMRDVDPRWQMLIAVQLAKFSPQLAQVTFLNGEPRTAVIMQRFCSWFCIVR